MGSTLKNHNENDYLFKIIDFKTNGESNTAIHFIVLKKHPDFFGNVK